MTLVDTSAWIEFLRGTGSSVNLQLTRLIEAEETPATTEVVVMEILAGARDDQHRLRLRRLLLRCDLLPVAGLADYEQAADIHRRCRRAGATVRSLTDCLIAQVAIRTGVSVLHADRDFETIAAHTSLKIAS